MSQNKIQKYMRYDNNIKNIIFVFVISYYFAITFYNSLAFIRTLCLCYYYLTIKMDYYIHLVLFQKFSWIEMIKKHNHITF